ncbi:MAG: glucose-6-phosphate dehydrogenase [SAR86 cluster bacterium]|nr:glucose-6-phosphate dehydrogenase [SAR86 cluster bacterium]MDG2347669.1 glucose-6-phosphate dehydrogenase [SAR86 cluster bacterium]
MDKNSATNELSINLFIFGGTGDLAQRKLLPALFRHHKSGRLDNIAKIFGIGSSNLSSESYSIEIKLNLKNYLEDDEFEECLIDQFLQKICYLQIDFNNQDDFTKLSSFNSSDYRNLYYLAVSPVFYKVIAERLHQQSLVNPSSSIIVEKPIGDNHESSVEINESLALYFNENQIFRIDHYLGKEAVQNLLALRFGNVLFEKIWSNIAIDHVQITVSETLGLESRGSYYDRTGAIRDMLQNHLLQILCLVAMEPPTNITSESIRDEKLKVLRSLRPLSIDEADNDIVIGQYKDGAINSTPKSSYINEDGVDPKSQTETFVALKMLIDNWRWSGVPFFLRTGKRMSEKRSEIVIQFKSVPLNIFNTKKIHKDNQLVIRLQPEESIKLKIMIKKPSASGFELQELPLDLLFDDYYDEDHLDAYERLLMDIIDNKPSLFMRRDEVEEAWLFIDQLIKSIENSNIGLSKYNAGSWGPSSSDLLIAGHSAKWNNEEE